jgi:cyclin-dependent kinase 12/13
VFKAKISAKNSKSGKDQVVALKQINQTADNVGFPITSLREIRLLSLLKHKNVVDLIEVVTSRPRDPSKSQGSVYLVFEYMEHDLISIIRRKLPLNSSQIKYIMKQILSGVCFLHEHSVMHRDIKAANILVNAQGEIKLADFGLGLLVTGSRSLYTNPVVTLWYRAPELLLGSNSYTMSIDVWSVGCCFAELLNSGPIFNAPNEPKMLEQIYQHCGSPNEETWPDISQLRFFNDLQPKKVYPRVLSTLFKDNPKVDSVTMDLLDKMLIMNPNERITAKQALEHEYFTTQPLPCDSKELPMPEKEGHDYEMRYIFVDNKQTKTEQKDQMLEARKRKLQADSKQNIHLEPKYKSQS